jgi:hypothetical protein
MDESVRLRAIVEVCEETLERLMCEQHSPPAGFVEDVKRLRKTALAQLERLGDTCTRSRRLGTEGRSSAKEPSKPAAAVGPVSAPPHD